MEDVDQSPCAFAQSKERAAERLFIYQILFLSPSTPLCLVHSAMPPPPPLPGHCPCSSPICDVEAAIFSWRLPRLSPWRVTLMTNWVWKWRWWPVKAMALPPPCTLWTCTQRQADTQIHDCCSCAYAHLPHGACNHSAWPWDKARGNVANGVTTWMWNTQREQEI